MELSARSGLLETRAGAGRREQRDPQTLRKLAFSALRLGELALEAGLPPGVLNVVTGPGTETGAALGLHNDIDVITFTGSTSVGKAFMTYSAQSNLKQVWLECGGKSANIVFADCQDLDLAAEKAAFGICFNRAKSVPPTHGCW